MNLNSYFYILVLVLFVIVISTNNGFCENYNLLPLKIDSWQRLTVGNCEETEEGIKFYAASYRSNHRAISKEIFILLPLSLSGMV